MEWATQWHGPEGKIHADRRTVEYTGRGNHSADAVSFVGAISVGQELAARARRDARARLRRAPCLTTPLESAAPVATSSTNASDSRDSSAAIGDPDTAGAAVGSRPHESKKNKHRGNGRASAARKKPRVGAKDRSGAESDGADAEEDDAPELLQLPVYYFEVQVLATREFQCEPDWPTDGPRARSLAGGRDGSQVEGFFPRGGRDEDDDEDDENGEDDSEMRDDDDDDDDEIDDVSMDVDLMERAMARGDASAPWRGRARRLIHDHLRVTAHDILSFVSDGGMATMSRSGDGAANVGQNGNGTSGTGGDGDSGQQRPQQQHTNGNGSATNNRLVRSTSSTLSPPSPPHLSHQQLLLSFPLSSSTIQQIRLRLERQQQQTQSQRRRFSSSGSTESSSMSLTSAISTIHDRQRRDTVRRKRSNHRIAVGFMFCKHGGDYKRDVCHDELGRQACGIALVGKTGAVLSNGQTFLQTGVRFGHGDTVGCGVILDTRTFFWTVNGRVVATIPVSDVHHLDDYEDHSESDTRETEWFTAWANHLLPSVSLHEHGECVRAIFAGTQTERFQFDLDSFKQQQLKRRQTTLSTYAVSKPQNGLVAFRNEEEIMHKLVEDYFVHFGYGNALSALHDLHHSDQAPQRVRSMGPRHTIRQKIYAFKTQEALELAKHLLVQNSTLLLHCHILCVVDVLYNGKDMKRKGNNADAIITAQDILQEYLDGGDKQAENSEEIREFMSVLLYPSADVIPTDCAGRRFLIWQFREEVADAVNDVFLSDDPTPCALESLVDDLSELQRECLTAGVSPFPVDEDSRQASRFQAHHKRGLGQKKRRGDTRHLAEDSDDENDEECRSSSSGESEDDEDDDDDE